jgi:hypothetical protein
MRGSRPAAIVETEAAIVETEAAIVETARSFVQITSTVLAHTILRRSGKTDRNH